MRYIVGNQSAVLGQHVDKRLIAGWIAVVLSVIIASFWAFWGIIENFHEGWYYDSLLSNLGLMLVQYTAPMLIFLALSLVSISWPRFGGGLHLLLALVAVWFFNALTNPTMLLLIAPLAGLGLLYWFGRPQPRKTAIYLAIGVPIATLLIAGIEPVHRVSQRVDDGNLQARLISENGVNLVWAPAGPGWPGQGVSWNEAQRACQNLSEDGLTSAPAPQYIWRLPNVDEAVRSMARHGQNSGGVWVAEVAQATYETNPDKESPLWNVYSQVIYWWTSTEVEEEQAYIIVYDGKVWPRTKQLSQDYLGFRCVKEPPP